MKLSTLMKFRLPIAFAGAILGIEASVMGLVVAALLPDSVSLVLLKMGSGLLLGVSLFQLVRLFKELKDQKPQILEHS